jgi:hypothetical protein
VIEFVCHDHLLRNCQFQAYNSIFGSLLEDIHVRCLTRLSRAWSLGAHPYPGTPAHPKSLARRYRRYASCQGVPLQGLVSEGTVALIEAIRRFRALEGVLGCPSDADHGLVLFRSDRHPGGLTLAHIPHDLPPKL